MLDLIKRLVLHVERKYGFLASATLSLLIITGLIISLPAMAVLIPYFYTHTRGLIFLGLVFCYILFAIVRKVWYSKS
jgi:hypothetical protein